MTSPLFPIANTPIGQSGTAISYDWLFSTRSRCFDKTRGNVSAEVLLRVSRYMDPWNAKRTPMDWWTIINRCRAIENTARRCR